jgi:hypothetical protein
METSMAKKKKVRKRRGGAGAFSRPPSGIKLSVGAMRRGDKAKAEKEHPELLSLFSGIKEDLKENLATGKRSEYRKSLKKIYRLVYSWEKEGFLEDNQTIIARLRGVPLRPKANRFSGIVAICSDRDKNTVNRWSQELDTAFEAEVAPQRLISFLEKEASSKAKKSKAEEQNIEPKVKKPKKSGKHWGQRRAK